MPTEIKVDGAEDGNAQVIVTRVVSNSYFETVGTEIKAGRAFQSTDIQKAPPVVIISQAMARYYFKDQSPIGRTLAWRHGTQLVAGRADCRRRRRHARRRPHRKAEDDAVSRRHAGERGLDAAGAHGGIGRTGHATGRRDDPLARSESARSITCRRSRSCVTRRSRRNG